MVTESKHNINNDEHLFQIVLNNFLNPFVPTDKERMSKKQKMNMVRL